MIGGGSVLIATVDVFIYMWAILSRTVATVIYSSVGALRGNQKPRRGRQSFTSREFTTVVERANSKGETRS